MAIDLHDDFFKLFGIDRAYQLDSRKRDAAYLALQSQYHPDRAAHLDEAAKREYLMAATHINTGYQILKNTPGRARYLLQLAGVDTAEETNTAMPADFLLAQMQWREDILAAKTAKNIEALETLHHQLLTEMAALDTTLGITLDQTHDYVQAALAVRKYRFYEKLDEEIGDAIESILF